MVEVRSDHEDLPRSVAKIAAVIGLDKTLLLIGSLPRSGSRPWRVCLYVPKRLTADHRLVHVLGWQDAVKLHRAFTGQILQPSNVKFWHKTLRNNRIIQMRADGVPLDEIAAEFRLSKARVMEILAENEPPKLAAE